jgi:hypothetical protein
VQKRSWRAAECRFRRGGAVSTRAPPVILSGGVGATVDTCSKPSGGFRRIIGYRDLAKLAVTVERELTPPQPNPVTTEEAAIVATA